MSEKLTDLEARNIWDELHQGVFPWIRQRLAMGGDQLDVINGVFPDGLGDDPEIANLRATLAVACVIAATRT